MMNQANLSYLLSLYREEDLEGVVFQDIQGPMADIREFDVLTGDLANALGDVRSVDLFGEDMLNRFDRFNEKFSKFNENDLFFMSDVVYAAVSSLVWAVEENIREFEIFSREVTDVSFDRLLEEYRESYSNGEYSYKFSDQMLDEYVGESARIQEHLADVFEGDAEVNIDALIYVYDEVEYAVRGLVDVMIRFEEIHTSLSSIQVDLLAKAVSLGYEFEE